MKINLKYDLKQKLIEEAHNRRMSLPALIVQIVKERKSES